MEGLYARDKYENTAQIYDFSELQKKKRQRELREKRPFFITGAVLIISLLSVCFFLYFGDRVVKAQESANDIQYKVVEIKNGDSLWSIAKENMDNTNDSGFINIYQYIHEIKRCNNMKSNQINAGCYLMVPYYN
jgi:cell division protein YceG involved in septum cleavage